VVAEIAGPHLRFLRPADEPPASKRRLEPRLSLGWRYRS
jgi:hypothetical protein